MNSNALPLFIDRILRFVFFILVFLNKNLK
jgi:hypothetical protein